MNVTFISVLFQCLRPGKSKGTQVGDLPGATFISHCFQWTVEFSVDACSMETASCSTGSLQLIYVLTVSTKNVKRSLIFVSC